MGHWVGQLNSNKSSIKMFASSSSYSFGSMSVFHDRQVSVDNKMKNHKINFCFVGNRGAEGPVKQNLYKFYDFYFIIR